MKKYKELKKIIRSYFPNIEKITITEIMIVINKLDKHLTIYEDGSLDSFNIDMYSYWNFTKTLENQDITVLNELIKLFKI